MLVINTSHLQFLHYGLFELFPEKGNVSLANFFLSSAVRTSANKTVSGKAV